MGLQERRWWLLLMEDDAQIRTRRTTNDDDDEEGEGEGEDRLTGSWAASRGRSSKSKYCLGWSACIQIPAGPLGRRWHCAANLRGLPVASCQLHATLPNPATLCLVGQIPVELLSGRAGQT
jgi:hypothetical protein